jgi:hypothetical protein
MWYYLKGYQKDNLKECLKDWLSNKVVKRFEGIPSFLASSIWWAQNSSIFKGKDIHPEVTTDIILNMSKEFTLDINIRDLRTLVMPKLDFGIPWGFFDEVCQGHPPICGVGVVLFRKHNHFIHVRCTPGRGMNNRVEFIALQTLLETASSKGLKKLPIMGDSKLVIDWVSKKVPVSDVRMEPLLRDTKLFMQTFK